MVDLGIVMISIPNSEVLVQVEKIGLLPLGWSFSGTEVRESLKDCISTSENLKCFEGTGSTVWKGFGECSQKRGGGLGGERPERLLSRYFRRDKSLLFTLNLGQEIICGIPLLEWEKRYRTYFQCNCSRKQMDTWTTATKNRVLSATHTTLENVCLFIFLTM